MFPNLAELWQYKHLLYFMLWRDVKTRYKQTFLGPAWALLRPAITALMQLVIFNQIAGIGKGDTSGYFLMLLAGNMIWGYFSSTITAGSSSVVGAGGLVSKVYIPRLFIPLGAVTAPLVDFLLALPLFAVSFVLVRPHFVWQMVTMPLFVLLTLLAGLGAALWLAPITVRYRDVSFILGPVLQLWFYATPIVYTRALWQEKVPSSVRWIIDVNPMSGVVEGFRWSILGGAAPSVRELAPSMGVMVLLLVTGLVHYRRAERTFVDIL
jgi:lipopolysaccharide transport system permease protein